ncbi:MAG: hypothetical protein ACREKE_00305, partial [bacterium]
IMRPFIGQTIRVKGKVAGSQNGWMYLPIIFYVYDFNPEDCSAGKTLSRTAIVGASAGGTTAVGTAKQ